MVAVTTELAALADVRPDYELIRTCIAGSRAMKKQGVKYLPDPDESEPDEAARVARYTSYVQRAVFYPATGRTLRGLVGMVFDRDPSVQAPSEMDVILADANGGGIELDQQASATLSSVVSLGRAGLLVDYPKTNGQATTKKQLQTGNVRPVIIRFEPEDVINWRTVTIGSKVLLSLVVTKETYVLQDDGFAETPGIQYRVLRLEDGAGGKKQYTQEIWRDTPEATNQFVQTDKFTPTDGKGLPFEEIPFIFVGALDNNPDVDAPPLLDLAELNKAHFQNSADYEESVFMCGQPTPVLAGLSKQWVEEVLKNKIRLGSRGAIPLPVGGSAELLQATPNTMAFEALEHKEAQMVAIGAKLIENTGTQQTATEATLDFVMDNSVLGTCARNVSEGYRRCLNWCWQFMNGAIVDDPEVIDYELSTDFEARSLTAQDRDNIIKMWQAKAITYTEMRWNLKRSGTAYLSDEDAQAESQNELETSIENEANAAAALAEASGQVDPKTGLPPVQPKPGAAPPKGPKKVPPKAAK